MILLNQEQQTAVDYDGNIVITACPGSGKTRILTSRVIRGLTELESNKERVIALTFTNRAADEIQVRLDQENISNECLWAGTIHTFSLEWIIRPYAPYSKVTKFGFSIADEFQTEQILDEFIKEMNLPSFTRIKTEFTRNGSDLNEDESCQMIFKCYKARLREMKLIDYDDVLYLAFNILNEYPEIAATLASIIRVFCVDEVQDIQDLQFGILSTIYKAASTPPSLFFVGDEDQSIYESLGALTKNPTEIAEEFDLKSIFHHELKGNYRSTQRIIDFYRNLRPGVPEIESKKESAGCLGLITFQNQTIPKENLSRIIADLISVTLTDGVEPSDICVIAPQWWHVRSLARELVSLLPTIDFDAPGLSPIYSSRDNFWFNVSRLFLMTPSPSRTQSRFRWAREVLSNLDILTGTSHSEIISTPRRLLRLINSITSNEIEGMSYLHDVFSQLLLRIDLPLESCYPLKTSFITFFEKAENRIKLVSGDIPNDIYSFRKLFSHPSGVVMSTCHGIKGEEYDTVIAFGLLRGYVPNWSVIIKGTKQEANERESKLLYVICSRAKRCLHLIAETGRLTQSHRPYETAELLTRVNFDYDNDNLFPS